MCLSIPAWAAAPLHPAWLALGPGGQPVVRLVTDQDGCSGLRVDGRQVEFAQIAHSAAAWRPDLVIHVGDYFYRDDPCPAGNAGCTGSPTGDTWAAARADFFAPAAPLLAAAPWIFVRGNHEACDRTGEAWFRLLDLRPCPDQCRDRIEPYVVTTGELDWYVLDSTAADDVHPAAEHVADFAAQFAALAEHRGRRAGPRQRSAALRDTGFSAGRFRVPVIVGVDKSTWRNSTPARSATGNKEERSVCRAREPASTAERRRHFRTVAGVTILLGEDAGR